MKISKAPNNLTASFSKLKTQETYYGYKWIFHKTDKDDALILHGHCVEKPLKLDGLTGEIYDIKTDQRVARLDAKELSKLHNSKKFQEFTFARITWYNQEHSRNLFPMPTWVHNSQSVHTIDTLDDLVLLYTSKKILLVSLLQKENLRITKVKLL